MVQYSRPPICKKIRDFEKCNLVIKNLFTIRYDLMRVQDNVILIEDRIARMKRNSISIGKKGQTYNKIIQLRKLRQDIDTLQKKIAQNIQFSGKVPENVLAELFFKYDLGSSMAKLSGIPESKILEKLAVTEKSEFLKAYEKDQTQSLSNEKNKFGVRISATANKVLQSNKGDQMIRDMVDRSNLSVKAVDDKAYKLSVPNIVRKNYNKVVDQLNQRKQGTIFDQNVQRLNKNDKEYYPKLFGRALMNRLFFEAQNVRSENMFYEIERDRLIDDLEISKLNERHNIRQKNEAIDVFKYLQDLSVESFVKDVKDIFYILKSNGIVDKKTLQALVTFTNKYSKYLKDISKLENEFDFLSVNTLINRLSKLTNVQVESAMDEERKLITNEIKRQEQQKVKWLNYQLKLVEIKNKLQSTQESIVDSGLRDFQELDQYIPSVIPGVKTMANENRKRRELLGKQITEVQRTLQNPKLSEAKRKKGIEFLQKAQRALMGLGGKTKLPSVFQDIYAETELEKQKLEIDKLRAEKEVLKVKEEEEKLEKEVRGWTTFDQITYLIFVSSQAPRIRAVVDTVENDTPEQVILDDKKQIDQFLTSVKDNMYKTFIEIEKKRQGYAKELVNVSMKELQLKKSLFMDRLIAKLNKLTKWKEWSFLNPEFYASIEIANPLLETSIKKPEPNASKYGRSHKKRLRRKSRTKAKGPKKKEAQRNGFRYSKVRNTQRGKRRSVRKKRG